MPYYTELNILNRIVHLQEGMKGYKAYNETARNVFLNFNITKLTLATMQWKHQKPFLAISGYLWNKIVAASGGTAFFGWYT